MSKNTFYSLLEKYINNTISDSELSVLESFLDDKKYRGLATEFLYKDYREISKANSFNTKSGFDKLELRLGLNKKEKKVGIPNFYRYAAAIVILLAVGSFLAQQWNDTFRRTKANDIVDTEVRLITNDGKKITLNPEQNDSIVNGKNQFIGIISNGVFVHDNDTATEDVVYNTLEVPFGKHFTMQLADGSKVEMNAGSSLRYPTNFTNGTTREVYLKGEAFFEVSKNTEKPFIVNASDMNIEVLGTRFNVRAYADESAITTTLQEGAVKVFHEKDITIKSHVLRPNEQTIWNTVDNEHIKSEVAIEDYLAWRNGVLVFNKLSFKEIQKTLERHYDVRIKNSNRVLENKRITARLERKSLKQVLIYLNDIVEFEYQINGTEVIID